MRDPSSSLSGNLGYSHLSACPALLTPSPTLTPSSTQYLFFACIYIMFPSSCMNESTKHFGHAFWFSFQTASTIGYSGDPGMYPNPDW